MVVVVLVVDDVDVDVDDDLDLDRNEMLDENENKVFQDDPSDGFLMKLILKGDVSVEYGLP